VTLTSPDRLATSPLEFGLNVLNQFLAASRYVESHVIGSETSANNLGVLAVLRTLSRSDSLHDRLFGGFKDCLLERVAKIIRPKVSDLLLAR